MDETGTTREPKGYSLRIRGLNEVFFPSKGGQQRWVFCKGRSFLLHRHLVKTLTCRVLFGVPNGSKCTSLSLRELVLGRSSPKKSCNPQKNRILLRPGSSPVVPFRPGARGRSWVSEQGRTGRWLDPAKTLSVFPRAGQGRPQPCSNLRIRPREPKGRPRETKGGRWPTKNPWKSVEVLGVSRTSLSIPSRLGQDCFAGSSKARPKTSQVLPIPSADPTNPPERLWTKVWYGWGVGLPVKPGLVVL